MATESLIVELDARTAKLDAALAETDKRLDKLDKSTGEAEKGLGKLSSAATAVAGVLKTAAVASLALATAITTMTLKSAESEQQLAILSRQAKLSTGDFEALAFATKQYGIDAEQIADISKDLSDKLGEFGKAGTGAFQDYADVIGLSKEEAKAAAIEFENMSSDQVLGAMIANLEKAGASGNEVTFVLESMGNDLSRLTPLFTDNASELERLTGIYKQATEQLSLTSGEIQALQGAATSFDLLTDSLSKAGSLISAQLAPLLNDFFTSVIETVPEATQTIVDFINSFKVPEEISNIASVQSQIIESERDLVKLNSEKKKLSEEYYDFISKNQATDYIRSSQINVQTENYERRLKLVNEKIIQQGQLTEDLKAREQALVEQRESDESKPPSITAVVRSGSTTVSSDIQEIQDRFKTEEELLADKLQRDFDKIDSNNKLISESNKSNRERELELIGENNELKLELQREYDESIAELRQADIENALSMNEELSKAFEKNKKDETKANDKAAKDKRKTDEQYLSIASNINSALFNDNKAIKAAIVVADTASAIMKSLSINPYDYLNVGVIAANGAAQLAAITSSSPGDSSVEGTTSGSGQAAVPEPDEELFISETDVSGESNSQVITIKIDSDDSELAVALNGILSTAKTSGVIS